jgi:hypothetical protein
LVSAATVVATGGVHAPSSIPDKGTYTKAECKSSDKNCISSSNEGAGFLGTGWIILIVCAILLPIIAVTVYCCCIKKKHKNDDEFHRIEDDPKPRQQVYVAPAPAAPVYQTPTTTIVQVQQAEPDVVYVPQEEVFEQPEEVFNIEPDQ